MASPTPLLTAPSAAQPPRSTRPADLRQPVLRSGSPPAQRTLPLRQTR